MGCFKSKAADPSANQVISEASSGGVSRRSSGGVPHQQGKASNSSPVAYLTATYPFVVCCGGVLKTVPLLKQHDGMEPFQNCIGNLCAAFKEELKDESDDPSAFKFWVRGPEVSAAEVKNSKLYYWQGPEPENTCHRWAVEVNVKEDHVAFVVARCTFQPSVTLHMLPSHQQYTAYNVGD